MGETCAIPVTAKRTVSGRQRALLLSATVQGEPAEAGIRRTPGTPHSCCTGARRGAEPRSPKALPEPIDTHIRHPARKHAFDQRVVAGALHEPVGRGIEVRGPIQIAEPDAEAGVQDLEDQRPAVFGAAVDLSIGCCASGQAFGVARAELGDTMPVDFDAEAGLERNPRVVEGGRFLSAGELVESKRTGFEKAVQGEIAWTLPGTLVVEHIPCGKSQKREGHIAAVEDVARHPVHADFHARSAEIQRAGAELPFSTDYVRGKGGDGPAGMDVDHVEPAGEVLG